MSIIIVNWNSKDFLDRCLASITRGTTGVSYEVIVVDSGSFDGCEDMLAHKYRWVRFIQSRANVGFGRANNLAATGARGAALLFLNPDTEVREAAIERLYAHLMAASDAGVVGCRVMNTDGSLQTSCVQSFPTIFNQAVDADVLRRLFPAAPIWGTAALFATDAGVHEVEVVSGACMMMRRQVFEQLEGFGREYFMYGEDVDLCFRLRCAGFRNYHVGDTVITHHGGGSTGRTVNRFSVVMRAVSVNRFLRSSRGIAYSRGHRLSLIAVAPLRLALACLLSPAYRAPRARKTWRSTVLKWFWILRWALGRERWTRDYDLEHLPTDAAGPSCAGSPAS